MAIPTTREEFKDNILRRLGAPVIEINVDDDQIDDRIDDALKYFYDYHFDGSHKIYYKHQVTEQDKANRYITVPENIMGAVRLFPVGGSFGAAGMFDIRYQIALNDLYTLTSTSLVPYFMSMQHLQLIEELFVGQQPIRFNRQQNRLYIDMDWEKVNAGQFLVVEAYEVVDPDVYQEVWSDRWLQRYATVLVQEQWGRNLTKFIGMQLPGGVQFNGEQILQQARDDREKLEQEMISSYSLPVEDRVG